MMTNPFHVVRVMVVWFTILSVPAKGRVVTDSFTSSALQGNRQGDSTTRPISVYLPPDLSSLRGLVLDVGDGDEFGLMAENDAFHQALILAAVPHELEVFSGKHQDKLPERIAESLEYFSGILSPADANPPIILPGDADQDLDFDQQDIVAALQTGTYLTGSYAASEPLVDSGGDIDYIPVPEPSTAVLLALATFAAFAHVVRQRPTVCQLHSLSFFIRWTRTGIQKLENVQRIKEDNEFSLGRRTIFDTSP